MLIKVNLHCDTSETDAGVDDTPCAAAAATLAAGGFVFTPDATGVED